MGIFSSLFKKRASAEKKHFCSVVVPAAGASLRMGGADKMFLPLGGIPVLARTLMALEGSGSVDQIVVVARAEDIERIAGLCRDHGLTKVSKIICGGATRTDSVYAGVFETSKEADIIAVHDGARPLVTASIIDAAIAAAIKFNAAAPAVPVKDTVKSARGGIVTDTPDRATLYAVQTPQVFNAVIFKASMENARKKALELSDDCMAVEALDVRVHLTEGSYENIKITTPEDIPVAEAILKARERALCE